MMIVIIVFQLIVPCFWHLEVPDDLFLCRHTASIAAGNHGIPVTVAGHCFGNASGMAPHAQ